IEVETTSIDEVRKALATRADVIMLDNMPITMMKEAVALIANRAITEASGTITLDTVRAVAETGVDFISVGTITHSAPAVDISMKLK
ncbi:MAG TPA: nicotinate-nucleotide diphosphorylase (carboxylating), partial [Nitrospiraceae bacterium]|nr:nicotinate-nucleotide diphosphorylase (carboxylating) [Nitrospiraceae bacterium]